MFNEAFGIYLRNKQVLTETVLTEHLNTASENRVTLIKELIDSKVLSEATAYSHFASYMNIPIRDFQLTEINFDLIRNFPREKLIMNCAIPYRDNDGSVIFAISDPFRLDGISDIEKTIGKHIEYFLILPSKMNEILGYVSNKIQQNTVLDDFSSADADISEVVADEMTEEDAPVIVLCDSILKDAVARGASDIHIEPYENSVRVRYRIDGKLTLINNLRTHLYQSILARFKIMAELNIAERRIPQDGKISMQLNGSNYDFRVSTLPSIHGEKIVIRIYNKSLSTKDVAILGFNTAQEEIVYDAIARPHGIILLTGPTGSGKSTTLYTFLRYLNKEDTNIITVEDPVENEINGITQVQVNPKADLTFASALRSILRQDPNVIMIGEIRDEETAQIAVRAALTGHLVFSTIHTNDAASVVSRLIDMGIAPYLVSDSLLCSISQRLVRKLCPFCKQEHITTASETKFLKLDKPTTIFEPKGCPACNHTGFQGRTAVFEIIPINSEIRKIVMSKNYTSEILNKYVSKTFPTLMEHAKERVLAGDTSMSEFEDLMDVIHKAGGSEEYNIENLETVNEEKTTVSTSQTAKEISIEDIKNLISEANKSFENEINEVKKKIAATSEKNAEEQLKAETQKESHTESKQQSKENNDLEAENKKKEKVDKKADKKAEKQIEEKAENKLEDSQAAVEQQEEIQEISEEEAVVDQALLEKKEQPTQKEFKIDVVSVADKPSQQPEDEESVIDSDFNKQIEALEDKLEEQLEKQAQQQENAGIYDNLTINQDAQIASDVELKAEPVVQETKVKQPEFKQVVISSEEKRKKDKQKSNSLKSVSIKGRK